LAIIESRKLVNFSFHKFDLAEVAPPEELVGGGGLARGWHSFFGETAAGNRKRHDSKRRRLILPMPAAAVKGHAQTGE
jgi:hypothetical protein